MISGTVRDADGEPMRGVMVRALRWAYRGPSRRMAPGHSATTDDLGRYRMPAVRGGKYLVVADPNRPDDLIDRTAGETRTIQFEVRTWFPGVEREHAASAWGVQAE